MLPGRLEAVEALVNAGADLDVANSEGCTALVYACRYGRAEAAALLLRAGADCRLRFKGLVALEWARKEKKNAVLALPEWVQEA